MRWYSFSAQSSVRAAGECLGAWARRLCHCQFCRTMCQFRYYYFSTITVSCLSRRIYEHCKLTASRCRCSERSTLLFLFLYLSTSSITCCAFFSYFCSRIPASVYCYDVAWRLIGYVADVYSYTCSSWYHRNSGTVGRFECSHSTLVCSRNRPCCRRC